MVVDGAFATIAFLSIHSISFLYFLFGYDFLSICAFIRIDRISIFFSTSVRSIVIQFIGFNSFAFVRRILNERRLWLAAYKYKGSRNFVGFGIERRCNHSVFVRSDAKCLLVYKLCERTYERMACWSFGKHSCVSNCTESAK